MTNFYSISGKIYEFLSKEKLCDVTLVAGIDGKKIPAHRLVLCAATDFFNALLTSPMEEHNQGEVTVNNITGPILEQVVACCYTGSISIDTTNVEELLYAASFLLFDHLQKKCTEFLSGPAIINKSNCIGIWAMAMRYNFRDLKEVALSVVNINFMEIARNDEFKLLSIPDLSELLASDDIAVNSEEDVFSALIEWVEYDVSNRKTEFPELLVQYIRVNLLEDTFIQQQVLHYCEQYDCEDAFLELNFSYLNISDEPSPRSKPFPGFLALDYSFRTENTGHEEFSQRLKAWTALGNVDAERYGYGAALVDKRLIFIGGNSGMALDKVDCIDLSTRQFRSLRPMIFARCHPTTLAVDGLIYAFGGKSRSGRSLRSAEMYNIKLNKWFIIQSMSVARGDAATAKFSGRIFIMGGFNGQYLNSVEAFDITRNRWSSMAPMICEREAAQAGVANGYLYVVGGYDYAGKFSSIERYDPKKNTWILMNFELKIPRSNFGMAVYQDWFIVAGGVDDDVIRIKSCEKINMRTGENEDMVDFISPKGRCHLFPLTMTIKGTSK